MALNTFSLFTYGHVITNENQNINFDEGAGELSAQIAIGDYTLGEFAIAVQTAMNTAAVLNVYDVTVNRTTRTLQITGDTVAFDLLITTGSQLGTSAFPLMGFTGADLTAAMTYEGNNASGSKFEPQFLLQDYVNPGDFVESVQSSVNESASGEVETVNFGKKEIVEFSIPFITDIAMDGKVIKNNATGVADARAFFLQVIDKVRFEFIPDIDTPATFFKVILESTPENREGTSFKLKERFRDNLPGIFETGLIRLRVVE